MQRVFEVRFVRSLVRAARVVVLLLAWVAATSLALALVAGGYGPLGLVVAFVFVRLCVRAVIPERWVQRVRGLRWVWAWVIVDALTLLGAGVLILGGIMIAGAALASPIIWSGLPGILCVIAGLHSGAMLASSAVHWASPQRHIELQP